MSIQPSLRFNYSADAVKGFEDLGVAGSQSDEAANLLLVFMLRGNYTSWKQPIAYFLVSHSVASEDLQKMIMRILRDVHETGIEVCEESTFIFGSCANCFICRRSLQLSATWKRNRLLALWTN